METYHESAEVLSTKDWLITLIIAAIPIVNIIMMFVWGFGDGTNPNKANWAKAYLLFIAIAAVLYFLLMVVVFGVMWGSGGNF